MDSVQQGIPTGHPLTYVLRTHGLRPARYTQISAFYMEKDRDLTSAETIHSAVKIPACTSALCKY